MSKQSSGINDRQGASVEQSYVEGNSGIANLIEGAEVPEPPAQLDSDLAKEFYRHAKKPDKRHDDIF